MPFLDQIAQPVLLMYGDKDILVPIEIAERAKSLLVNSELKVYENVGHMIQMEVTEQTAQDVLAFLATHVAGQQADAVGTDTIRRLPTTMQRDYAPLDAGYYPVDNIVKGEYGIALNYLAQGQVDIVTTQVNPFSVIHDKPFPFDEVVVVLEGEIHLQIKGEEGKRIGKPGAMFWVPKGIQAEDEAFIAGESGYYRSMVFAPAASVLASGEDKPVEGNPELAARSERYDFISTELPDFAGFKAPPIAKELILAGEDDVTIYQLYSGQMDIIATKAKPVTIAQGRPALIDKALYITEGGLKVDD